MADIFITGMKGRDRGDWDPEGYARRHFGMYAGRPCPLRLRCENRLAGVVIDRFGLEVSLVPDGEGHFTATVDVVASPPLWGWLFGLGPGWRCCPRTGRWTSSPASSRRCGRRIIRPRMGQTA